MEPEAVDQDAISRVDRAMGSCRQGDCFLGELDFVTLERGSADQGETQVVATPVAGLVLVSQSCDIARECSKRPMVELSPLVIVEQEGLEEIVALRQPRFAAVPALAGQRLVADLDRTMTVHKAVAASWARTTGVRTDDEARAFARALARKRARFAFPDDFNSYVQPLRERITGKHDRISPEGDALRALLEVRVRATPGWETREVQLTFYFVRGQHAPNGVRWQALGSMARRVAKAPRRPGPLQQGRWVGGRLWRHGRRRSTLPATHWT